MKIDPFVPLIGIGLALAAAYVARNKKAIVATLPEPQQSGEEGFGFNVWDWINPAAKPSPINQQQLPSAFDTLGVNLTDPDYLYKLSTTPPIAGRSASLDSGAQFMKKRWLTPAVGEYGPDKSGNMTERVVYDGRKYDAAFRGAELKYGIPAGVLSRLAWQESRYNPSAISPVGAVGMMQIMPSTIRLFTKAFPEYPFTVADAKEPRKAIDYAGFLLSKMFREIAPASARTWPAAIVAYNQGSPNVNKAIAANGPMPLDWVEWFKKMGYKDGYGYFQIAVDTGLVPAGLASIMSSCGDR